MDTNPINWSASIVREDIQHRRAGGADLAEVQRIEGISAENKATYSVAKTLRKGAFHRHAGKVLSEL